MFPSFNSAFLVGYDEGGISKSPGRRLHRTRGFCRGVGPPQITLIVHQPLWAFGFFFVCFVCFVVDNLVGLNAQIELAVHYKSNLLEQKYKPDFICFDKIIVEIKAVKELTSEHRAQVHNYLHATGYKLGLLVNFSHYPKVESERIVL